MLKQNLVHHFLSLSCSQKLHRNMITARFDEKFEVKKLTKGNKHETLELMKQHFMNDYVLKYVPSFHPQDIEDYLNSRFDKCVKQDYSFAIFEKSSKIMVAATLNYIRKKEPQATGNPNLSPALQNLSNLMAQLEENLFETLKCDAVFDIGINTTVHTAYRNFGFFTLIAEGCLYLSLQTGCKYLTVRPTTEYLIKAGDYDKRFKLLNEIRYADFVDPITKEKPFINAKYPHVRAQLLFIDLKKLKVEHSNVFSKL